MSNKGLLWLPSYRLDSLKKVIKISGCESSVYLFQSGAEYNLPNLHTILVENCQRMQALIESKGHSDNVADFKVQPRSEKLKVIRISDCENLVYLFKTKMLPYTYSRPRCCHTSQNSKRSPSAGEARASKWKKSQTQKSPSLMLLLLFMIQG
ncbi:hypothetical protein PRUPE_4G038400 [Prunus persica]|uniref:Uncharacterized protein n=1 Tax=Prunus persica TaxID=3760 RepID=A0A251PGX2_PRUPE|nr:hypothetical protein PRUPE_4G038400 [Prunus persica]